MKSMLQAVIRQYRTWKPSVATRNIIYHFLTRERKRSYGPRNPETTFYVIRGVDSHSPFYIGPVHNLLANYFYVLSHLQYARIKGYTPVIDQQNYPVYNSLPYPVNGTMNAWEYFWQQPCDTPLEEVYRSKHVVLSQRSWYWQWDMGYDIANYTDPDVIARFHQLADRVPLSAQTALHIRQTREKLIPDGEKVLGICYRFGGHAKGTKQGPGHPVSPEVEDLLSVTQARFREWGMQKVFLTSDEKTIIDSFRAVFGDRLIVLPRKRMQAGERYDKEHPNQLYEQKNQHDTALGYLTEMELLASCGALIGSVNSGLRYAVVRNGNRYEHVDILDRGLIRDTRK